MPLLVGLIVWLLVSMVLGERIGGLYGLAAALVMFYFQSGRDYKALVQKIERLQHRLDSMASEDDIPGQADMARQDSIDNTSTTSEPDWTVAEIEEPFAAQPDRQVISTEDAGLDVPEREEPGTSASQPLLADSFAARNQADQPEGSTNALSPGNLLTEQVDRVVALVKRYFTDGNLFVRIGILVLFAGVAFLLKYAAENSQIPIEYRIASVGLLGMAILVFGWRLRESKSLYGLLLQGAGIGVLYLVFFSAFRIYELIPPTLTFLMLVILAVMSAVLAVLQNSRALAAFGIIGGFVAPILASSGSGNYVGLFSYYVILNAGVIAIAWFRAWRIINMLGFNFTYLVLIFWTFTAYEAADFSSVQPFLVTFFLMFNVVSVLYALRQPVALKGYVDASLVFGNPIIAWTLQMYIVRHIEYGIGISALIMGAYHIILARTLWRQHREGMRLYAESLLSIGVVFLTLAIPYSLDGHWTSATWALEGAGILWIGLRQNRRLAQYFGLLLEAGAAFMFLFHFDRWPEAVPFLNAGFIGGMIIAISALFSAWQLNKYCQSDAKGTAVRLHPGIFVWGILWWTVVGIVEVFYYFEPINEISGLLAFFMLTSVVLWLLHKRLIWHIAGVTSILAIPILMITGLAAIDAFRHPLTNVFALMIWIAMGIWMMRLLWELESRNWNSILLVTLNVATLLFFILLVSVELQWRLSHILSQGGNGWQAAYWMLLPLTMLWYLQKAEHWPFSGFNRAVSRWLGLLLVVAGMLWGLVVTFEVTGDAWPLPYIPVLNPLDMAHLIIMMLAFRFWLKLMADDPMLSTLRSSAAALLGLFAFVWVNAMQLRTIHHYFDMPFSLEKMLSDIGVQMSLSILWTIIGMLCVLIAAKKNLRKLWIAGAVLVSIVLAKLILVDLSAAGTIERVVSFMAVGLLLVGMGYFSPIPDNKETEQLP